MTAKLTYGGWFENSFWLIGFEIDWPEATNSNSINTL